MKIYCGQSSAIKALAQVDVLEFNVTCLRERDQQPSTTVTLLAFRLYDAA